MEADGGEARSGNGDDETEAPLAALHHLTGPARSAVTWLNRPGIDLRLDPGAALRALPARPGAPGPGTVARFRQTGGTYLVEAPPDRPLWINGTARRERQLRHGDMLELGEDGPLCRFELIDAEHPMRRTIPAILEDTLAYLRVSRRPWPRRLLRGLSGMAAQLLRETTVLFRVAVLLSLAAVAGIAVQQALVIDRLERGLETGTARLDAVAAALAQAREDALRPADLETLRRELAGRVEAQGARIESLERLSGAAAEVIARTSGAIAFLQGAYGLRERETGRMLRLVVDAEGRIVTSRLGKPLLTLEGDGPVAEREFTGTGFLAGGPDILATGRHVALPWERDPAAVAAEGFEPVPLRLRAFLPGMAEPVPAAFLAASETADVALLRLADPLVAAPLPLAAETPNPGATVLVIGYPTGLRSMLARSGERFVEKMKASGDTGFWTVAESLAAAGHIRPLASRGIVGEASETAVVFDAETTHGGSGGPVLDLSGRVVGVQSAILPEYGGSNLAVPAAALARLLDDRPDG